MFQMKNILDMTNGKSEKAEEKINGFSEEQWKPSKMKHEEKKGRVSVSCETPQWPNIHVIFKGEERDGEQIKIAEEIIIQKISKFNKNCNPQIQEAQ